MESISIGISGVSGRIGQRLVRLIVDAENLQLNSGIVSESSPFLNKDIGVLSGLQEIGIKASSRYSQSDIWIDFSTAEAFDTILMHCIATKSPLVTGTTGLSKNQFKAIKKAGVHIPILWASNFSVSINLIQNFLAKYARLGFKSNINIIETHHTHKVDKPSGTALTLAQSYQSSEKFIEVDELKFKHGDINIESIREGEVAGIHNITIDNESENIEITHSAKTPDIFAQGALNIAQWLIKQTSGYYTMNQYLEQLD